MGWKLKKQNIQEEQNTLEQENNKIEKEHKKERFQNWKIRRVSWIKIGIAVCFLCSLLFTSFYSLFQNYYLNNYINPFETEEHILWLYQNSFLLYHDLYNKTQENSVSYEELYFKRNPEFEWFQETEMERYLEIGFYDEEREKADLSEEEMTDMINTYQEFQNYFDVLNEQFSIMNTYYDYVICDTITGETITNMLNTQVSPDWQHFYLSFQFDANGNITIGKDVMADDVTKVRKIASEVGRNGTLSNLIYKRDENFTQIGSLETPKNCIVTFCMDKNTWEKLRHNSDLILVYTSRDTNDFYNNPYNFSPRDSYLDAGAGEILLIFWSLLFVTALFLPMSGKEKSWRENKLCSLPVEVLFCIGGFFVALASLIVDMAWVVGSGSMTSFLTKLVPHQVVFLFNLLVLCLYFFVPWYLGVCADALREMGMKQYIKERSLIYAIFPFTKGKLKEIYCTISHFDLTQNAHKMIIKIVIVNAVILFVISSLWLGGFAVTVVYSAILYFVLKKYISDLQGKYNILLQTINEIAQGNLNGTISKDLGIFEPFKPQIYRIQTGFKKAVEEEVKSQRMKAELITNVSHDLKTPLTAIITYVNLLKEEDITEEQRKEYLDTLDKKALRMKVLIEDLFEVSKANSQNITLNIVDVDIINLIKQVSFEMTDKLEQAKLDLRMNLTDKKVILPLDSQKTYRIYENLFGNIAKYALSGTRVYVDSFYIEDSIVITLKNITEQELSISPEELSERFVRGDSSRNTEGSGLGLAIAKSFTELQNGKFSIEIDGDLFKVITVWKLASEK